MTALLQSFSQSTMSLGSKHHVLQIQIKERQNVCLNLTRYKLSPQSIGTPALTMYLDTIQLIMMIRKLNQNDWLAICIANT